MISFLPRKKINYARIEHILSDSFEANHYTNNGPVKIRLEAYLENLFKIDRGKRVVCCSNGTVALHSILYLCNEKFDCKNWLTPAFTFPSCVVGAGNEFKIDICDIDPNTYTLTLSQKLFLEYDGTIITNLFGSFTNLPEWVKFCKKEGKILIFDNAASPLSLYNGVNICNFGDYSFGSLHHTKYLGFGEGGFIVCPQEDYDKLNSITNFGFFFNETGFREFKRQSSNFKISDVSAAFILNHIETYSMDKHLKNQGRLVNGISKMQHVKPFNYKPGTVYNTFPVVFNQDIDESYFCDLGIKTHKYYQPISPLPNSMDIYNKIINFPLYADMSAKQIEHIINIIGDV